LRVTVDNPDGALDPVHPSTLEVFRFDPETGLAPPQEFGTQPPPERGAGGEETVQETFPTYGIINRPAMVSGRNGS